MRSAGLPKRQRTSNSGGINALTLADVPFRDIPVDDMTSKQIHQLGEPMTGAFFDILVASYQKNLIASGAIPKELAVLDDDPDSIERRCLY